MAVAAHSPVQQELLLKTISQLNDDVLTLYDPKHDTTNTLMMSLTMTLSTTQHTQIDDVTLYNPKHDTHKTKNAVSST